MKPVVPTLEGRDPAVMLRKPFKVSAPVLLRKPEGLLSSFICLTGRLWQPGLLADHFHPILTGLELQLPFHREPPWA